MAEFKTLNVKNLAYIKSASLGKSGTLGSDTGSYEAIDGDELTKTKLSASLRYRTIRFRYGYTAVRVVIDLTEDEVFKQTRTLVLKGIKNINYSNPINLSIYFIDPSNWIEENINENNPIKIIVFPESVSRQVRQDATDNINPTSAPKIKFSKEIPIYKTIHAGCLRDESDPSVTLICKSTFVSGMLEYFGHEIIFDGESMTNNYISETALIKYKFL